MFVDERPGCFRVALGANCVVIGRGAKLIALERSMGIVAICALDQSLWHFVMEGLREGHPHIRMARFAKLRLRGLEMVPLVLEPVGAMAVDTA
jgi:hypothetical protein